jgi:hypothetical protein
MEKRVTTIKCLGTIAIYLLLLAVALFLGASVLRIIYKFFVWVWT